ncbi:hypothetical protein GLAREA_06484 [Glarea lozoyensis ATCC 20868]|uniref:Uncharacterized protein n=1 Tax=Glarea lozoyensis (strain ATCC 20868 / MF5171) TaxID=1116229 RepID=S3DMZ8_GLAL2|nr:uncharacterized protein GLAREA_06484 [Glarea lozoyensis ATCC 20868]EPE33471.1 hypothetical protein GLAREA_06484 [Glarea lozoyensis ATCC 20868]
MYFSIPTLLLLLSTLVAASPIPQEEQGGALGGIGDLGNGAIDAVGTAATGVVDTVNGVAGAVGDRLGLPDLGRRVVLA